jgi:hypothetical protein
MKHMTVQDNLLACQERVEEINNLFIARARHRAQNMLNSTMWDDVWTNMSFLEQALKKQVK